LELSSIGKHERAFGKGFYRDNFVWKCGKNRRKKRDVWKVSLNVCMWDFGDGKKHGFLSFGGLKSGGGGGKVTGKKIYQVGKP